MKIYIKCQKDNTFLNPFVYGEQWVNSICDAHPFEVEEYELDDLKIDDIVVDCFLNKDDLIIVYKKENKMIEHIKFTESLLSYDVFLKTKKEFLLHKNKKFEHYLIYTYIKKKDPYRAISFGKNKFHETLNKIKSIIYMIESKEHHYDHLKSPFKEISDNDFKTILTIIRRTLK